MPKKTENRIEVTLAVFSLHREFQLPLLEESEDPVGSLEKIFESEVVPDVPVAEAEDFQLGGDLPSIFRDADATDDCLPDLVDGRAVFAVHAARSESSV